MRFDLQSHSTRSDGELAPAEVVARAAAAGVELLALSDHDTVEGVREARLAAVAQGIGLVPAVEISALYDDGQDLHILGYLIDTEHRDLREVLSLARKDRAARATRITTRLHELGFELNESALAGARAQGSAIGRPHLAAAVMRDPANAARLAQEGLTEQSKFFEAYLLPGGPAFSPRHAPSVEGAIELIHAAGGVAVWAHPFWDIADPQGVGAMLERFARGGLDGAEVFYVSHTAQQTAFLHARAQELGLLRTGSADFHGPSHSRFNAFLGYELYGLEPELGPIAGSS